MSPPEPTTLLGTTANPCRVGDVDNPAASPVRIVHISDTHLQHNDYVTQIPDGDILVHSGDFTQYGISKRIFPDRDYCKDVQEVDMFFSQLPHKHKIFVAGNHELNFTGKDPARTQTMLKHGVYLQDASVVLEGIKFYGAPWNKRRSSSYARGFSVESADLEKRWQLVPEDVDVLVTHSPPGGITGQRLGCAILTHHVLSRIRSVSSSSYFAVAVFWHFASEAYIGHTDSRQV